MKMDMEKMDHRSAKKDHTVIEMTEVVIAEVEEIVVVEVTVVVAEVIAEVAEIVARGDKNQLIIKKKKATVKAAFFYLTMISNEYPEVSTGSIAVRVSGNTLFKIIV